MRKKIIIIVGIIAVLLICGFTGSKIISANSELQAPTDYELKTQYSSDANGYFISGLKDCTKESLNLYKNLDTLKVEDMATLIESVNGLLATVDKDTESETEKELINKIMPPYQDLMKYSMSSEKATRTKLKSDMQDLLNCYKY